VAYALMRDEVDRERLVAATLRASGVEVDLPSRYRLDVALGLADERQYDEATAEWREAVGLPA
jgi:hypothetical protein